MRGPLLVRNCRVLLATALAILPALAAGAAAAELRIQGRVLRRRPASRRPARW